MRVLVTDGDSRAALAVTRSLGRAGHRIIVGERRGGALAHASRYCAQRVVYPDPASAPEEFVDELASVVREQAVDVLIPVADIALFLVTGHRERFEGACLVPFADAPTLDRAANKVDTLDVAVRVGVPVPRSVVVSSGRDLPSSIPEFPVVIKPWRSRVRTADGWAMTAVNYAATHAQLVEDLARRPSHEFPVILQERIAGPGVGVFACYHEGRAVAFFSHRRLRERPPWGGVSVLSESTALDPQAAEYATRLLDALRWHGVAMVEFKQDSRDDTPKLMEINGRFWGSLQLAIDAGVDFPALLLHGAMGKSFAAQPPYRIGVRSRWLWGDVDSLLATLFWRQAASRLSYGDRLWSIVEFMKLRGRNLHYDNPKWDDVQPWLAESSRWVKSVVRGSLSTKTARTVGSAPPLVRSTSSAMQARIVTSLDRVGLDENGWNSLAAKSDTNSVFQTHQWTSSWLTAFGDRYEPLFVTVSDASGVAGVAPLVLKHSSHGDRVVRFIGDGRADYCDLLAGGSPQVLSEMFHAIRDYGRWDVIELNNVPAHSRTIDVLRGLCGRTGYRMLTDDRFVCPTLLIEGHEADARRMFAKPSLRRPLNYFRRHGRLVCRNVMTKVEMESYLDSFFDQHIARWAETKSPSLFLDSRNRDFYRILTASLHDQQWLLFSVIEFDDRPIAFHYGFDYGGAVIWYKPSFDPAFAERSPGLLLVRHLIGYALEQRRRELDFTVGDEPFKNRFTNRTRKTVRIQVFQDSARYIYERSRRNVAAAMKRLARTSSVMLGVAPWP